MCDDNEEDYEAIRQKNIEERNAFLKDFFKEIKENTEVINNLERKKESIIQKENKTPANKRRRSQRRSPTFKGTRTFAIVKEYNTRSRKKKVEDIFTELEDEDSNNSKKSLKVMFSWARPAQRDIDLMRMPSDEEYQNTSEESEDESFTVKRRKVVQYQTRSQYDPNNIPSPDEITDAMLKNVASKLSKKTYDAINGTSCHQCRQKTKDTKTVCRSGECVGVRGQFCGPCLQMRYGENIIEALKDPHWSCPPCRGLCNCSICRTRNGQRPTGILAPIAKEEGYQSVKDYLIAMDEEK